MINKVITAAKLAGKELTKHFGQSLTVTNKSSLADFRTEADLASEKVILDNLQQDFPDYNFFSEEKGWIKNDSDFTFVIDPLDGTNNFTIGLPNFSISIALQKNKETILGVVYQPILKEVFWAEKDKGAYLNKSRLKTNGVESLQEATVSYLCGYKDSGKTEENLLTICHKYGIKRLLSNWSPALDFCRLASGKIESIICNGNDIYDNMAGKLIVKEAGGIITQLDGSKEQDETSTYFTASSNKHMHQKILDISQQLALLPR
ncbi:inositol monophosphatase [Patescibacteria group bacterium]|nr:inositol monophosphatase [Patescibacteria group bacterium]